MTNTDSEISSLSRDITREFRRKGTDLETKQWASRQIRAIGTDMELLNKPEGYRDFLLDYINRELTRWRASSPEDLEETPYDEPRSDRLCTCRKEECPIQQGRIPREIRTASSFYRGVREFKQKHRGDPIVLADAREKWAEKRNHVKSRLRLVLSALANNQIPDHESESKPITPGAQSDPTATKGSTSDSTSD